MAVSNFEARLAERGERAGDDVALLETSMHIGRRIAAGVVHDLNSGLQALGDALYTIGEDTAAMVDLHPHEPASPSIEVTGDRDPVQQLRDSLQRADSAYFRVAATTRVVYGLVPALQEDGPIDLGTELNELVALTTHQWRDRLDVSVVVDPAMRAFSCRWWIARLAALRMLFIGFEAYGARRRTSVRPLPRLRLIGAELEGQVELRAVCDFSFDASGMEAPPEADLASDETLVICARRLRGEVSTIPVARGSFGVAFRFPVRVPAAVEDGNGEGLIG